MKMTPEQLCGQDATHLTEVLFGQKLFLIHPQVEQDLLALRDAAAQAGFNLNIASGFRDFERQKTIWNNKMSGISIILDSDSLPLDPSQLSDEQKVLAILRWSALPGASRHHWGTEFDVFDRNSLPKDTTLQLEPWEYLTGHQAKFYQWLSVHLKQFGFFFPYQKDLGGVAAEPWHISHKVTATECLTQLTQDQLAKQLQASDLLGKNAVLQQLDTIYTQFITNICRGD